jgi:hypothetical protein
MSSAQRAGTRSFCVLATLRQRNVALLWIGGVISMIGDWMLFIGLPLYVNGLTSSTLATGITFMIEMLPHRRSTVRSRRHACSSD